MSGLGEGGGREKKDEEAKKERRRWGSRKRRRSVLGQPTPHGLDFGVFVWVKQQFSSNLAAAAAAAAGGVGAQHGSSCRAFLKCFPAITGCVGGRTCPREIFE
ncbi:hypothetical protein GGTG_07048 [Gaeumannomyces tritici R3-111a-1]|uniref:Uncharacterized protein n=1 Tax=Gaeumannomyces tritici (strain R3-111a-1) TaxID=644352 RepID=J3P0K3_GAET3|nr:hypothetical protein GGTG_07048 [Gaeumannomyces tritici R3-111a-1]EJT77136.1 hypothetical protein GGTG_07048 [Gaeumannomyces tritici R3-111a-1]